MIFMRRVSGRSMEPVFKHDKTVVAVKAWRLLRAGDVVVVRHEGLEKIKRIEKLDGDRIFLLGDNQACSTDSRHYGWVSATIVTGKVVWPINLSKSQIFQNEP